MGLMTFTKSNACLLEACFRDPDARSCLVVHLVDDVEDFIGGEPSNLPSVSVAAWLSREPGRMRF